jgi:hypothetical protein
MTTELELLATQSSSKLECRVLTCADFDKSSHVIAKVKELNGYEGVIPIVDACRITGYSRGGLEKKVKSGDVELTPQSLMPLVVSLAPVYENWPTLTEAAKRLKLPPKLLQEWAKSTNGQKSMQAVIAQKLYRVSPKWVERFEKKLGSHRDKYIFSEEAAQILGCETDEMTQFRTIKSIQPAGAKTKRLYLRSSVEAYANRVAENTGFFTVIELARELGVSADYVRNHFTPDKVDSIEGRLFTQETLDAALLSDAAQHMRIDELLLYCQKQYGQQIWLETKVKELMNTGTLVSFSMGTHTRRFLDDAGQKAVKNMYANYSQLMRLSPLYAESFKQEELLSTSKAIGKLEWNISNLERLFSHTPCLYLSEPIADEVHHKLFERDLAVYFKLMPNATRRFVRQTDLATLAQEYNSILDRTL